MTSTPLFRLFFGLAFLSGISVLPGCGGGEIPSVEHAYPEKREGTSHHDPRPTGERESILGPGGVQLGGKAKDDVPTGAGIGINGYLWRASLDTIAFMPLSSADPFGGVIITDWYTPGETPDERVKVTVYILDRRLRADGLKVAVFRQKQQGASWADTPVHPQTAINMENAILLRARQLRLAQIAPN
ncbi:MAG: DUF3576 domain-containing protein [Alphaproteobacteria bacterium]|nr:DUF3576 domain-containing protein [Alphaproteobacteria bacterium]